jgi:hypothetical protein
MVDPLPESDTDRSRAVSESPRGSEQSAASAASAQEVN